jgi:hypothetical protein
MLGALYGQPWGDRRGRSGPSCRLNPYLVGQCPGSIPAAANAPGQPQSTDMLCCSVHLGDRVGRGRGARRSKGPSGALGNFGAGRGAALVVVGRQFIVAGPDIEPRNPMSGNHTATLPSLSLMMK